MRVPFPSLAGLCQSTRWLSDRQFFRLGSSLLCAFPRDLGISQWRCADLLPSRRRDRAGSSGFPIKRAPAGAAPVSSYL